MDTNTKKRWFKHRTFKIRVAISWVFSSLLLLSTVITTTYTFVHIESAMDRTARDLIGKTQNAIINETLMYLKPAMNISQMGGWMFKTLSSNILDSPTLIHYMLGGLKIYSQTSLIYGADIKGNYLAIGHSLDKRVFAYQPNQPLPRNVSYFMEITDRRGNLKNSFQYLNDNGDVVAREDNPHVDETTYDPRKRDWFKRTQNLKNLNWSEVYIGYHTSDFMITASCPVFDIQQNFVGIVAVDVPLERIGDLLAHQKASRSGINFIITPKGQVIGFPEIGRNILFKDGIPSIKSLEQMNEPILMEAYRLYQQSQKNQFKFTYDDIDHYAHFMSFPDQFASPWILAMVAPVDDFVGPIKETNRAVMIISIIILGICSIILIVFSHKISYPIEALAEQMHHIKQLDIENNDLPTSSLQEIAKIENALTLMKDGLGAFSKFVPKELVRALISGGVTAELGGERRSLAIMFCDVANFTTISEGLDSDKLMVHLSQYFDRLSRVILKNKGTIDKYIGDSIMAFWGAPLEDDDRMYNACHAVLQCHRLLNHMNAEWKRENKVPLPTRFGLHYGDVIVGNVGSADRLNYTVIGDSVNVASRLEGANKMYGTHIIVSEPLYQAVKNRFLMRPVDIVIVKGRDHGINIYELLAEHSDDADLQPMGNQITIATLTFEAFQAYLSQDWNTASEIYKTILKLDPADTLSRVYVKRCHDFKRNHPPENWNGTYHMMSK